MLRSRSVVILRSEAGRRAIVRFALAIYRLGKTAGKDPAGDERSETSRLDNPLDPHYGAADCWRPQYHRNPLLLQLQPLRHTEAMGRALELGGGFGDRHQHQGVEVFQRLGNFLQVAASVKRCRMVISSFAVV